MTMTRKNNKLLHPPLIMNNTINNQVTEHKHLGLEISNDGSWQKHIDLITKKAFTRVNILRKFKFILDRKTLEKIYLTFIPPILEYADVVWDNKTLFLINKLENVEIEAARVVTGGIRLLSINSLYIETGWETLQARREHHTNIYFYKLVNGHVLPYLSAMVSCYFKNIHDYNTRQAVSITPVRTRTTLHNNYFLPSTVRLWNIEHTSIRDSRSPSSLKSYHKSKCIKKPIYYYLGTRIEQILHMRLRTTCSSLSHHLFLKNIVDSPNCSCHQGVPETNSHYLFHCHRFNDSRNPYIESIDIPMNLTVDRLLF